jgi:nitrogen regulatory protein PII
MFHEATKLIIVTEKFIIKEVCNIIDACGAKGYTLVPAGGKGIHHFHPTDASASLVDDFNNIKIEVVCMARQKADSIAQKVMESCFTDYPGIIYLENVEVLRSERF